MVFLCKLMSTVNEDESIYKYTGCTAPTVTKENETTMLLKMVNQIWKQFQKALWKRFFCYLVQSLWGMATFCQNQKRNSSFFPCFRSKLSIYLCISNDCILSGNKEKIVGLYLNWCQITVNFRCTWIFFTFKHLGWFRWLRRPILFQQHFESGKVNPISWADMLWSNLFQHSHKIHQISFDMSPIPQI